jgi:hypothetical protein
MSSVVIAGNTSGTVTLNAPDVAGTTTLTLPTTNGTVLTTGSSTGISGSAISTGTVAEAYGGTGTSTGYYGFKNRIINGAMNVWQRGTSFSATGSNYYTADRWQNFGQTYTASRSTDVPTGLAQYSLDISGGAGSYGTICQRIEAANCADLVGQSVTISVYVKAVSGGANGLTCILDYATATDNFASQTNIGSATLTATVSGSWTKYTTTFNSLPSGAANGLQILFYNNSTLANQYRYTLVQLEKGSTATSFDYRPYGTELQLCQRYLPSVLGATNHFPAMAYSGNGCLAMIPFPVTARTAPTGITVSSVSGFIAWRSNSANAGNPSSITFNAGGKYTGVVDVSGFSAGVFTAGNMTTLQFNSSTGYLLFTGCEL